MKIYSKSNFIAGLICLGAPVLFAFGVIQADWWQWLISIAITAKFLYTGLTESGSRRAKHLDTHYEKTARMLYGKYHALKTNLPWILTIAFFAAMLLVRFISGEPIPVWVCVVFVLALFVSCGYSIGLQNGITEYIDEHIPEEDFPEP